MRSSIQRIGARSVVTGVLLMLGVMGAASAQTAQVRPRQRAASVQVIVRDQSGNPLEGVNVISGPNRLVATDAKGVATIPALPDGSYRFRFEREGFIQFEREVTIKGGRPAQIEVALRGAPVPPPPPAPVEAPPPPPSPPPIASGPPTTVSVPTFLERNFIGRDPLKESVLGCTASATTRLLQLREALAEHTHADLDEVIYVVAGEAAIRFRDQTTVLAPGSLTVIPRGVPHAVERRGKNPVVVLSMLSGAPCRTTAAP